MEIASALSSLSASIGLIKLAVDARDEAKINAAITDINKKYLELSMAALHLAEALSACQLAKSELERENRDLARKQDDRERYVLYALAPGRLAYKFAPSADSSEPEHYLCQLCYDKGVKSVLRLNERSDWSHRYYACAAVDKGAHDLYF